MMTLSTTQLMKKFGFNVVAVAAATTVLSGIPSQAVGAEGAASAQASLSTTEGKAAAALPDTEPLTDQQRIEINAALKEVGKKPVGQAASKLKYFDDGKVLAVDGSGSTVSVLSTGNSTVGSVSAVIASPSSGSAAGESASGNVAAKGVIPNEVKEIIGACLGFGSTGALSFEALVQKLATPANAAKFVVRRLGVFGAVSCAGGIIWKYI